MTRTEITKILSSYKIDFGLEPARIICSGCWWAEAPNCGWTFGLTRHTWRRSQPPPPHTKIETTEQAHEVCQWIRQTEADAKRVYG